MSLSYRIARKLALVGGSGCSSDAVVTPERNAPSPLRPIGPWLVRRQARRRARLASEVPSHANIEAAIEQLVGEIRAQHSIQVSPNGTWHDTGLELGANESVAILASGRLFLSRPLEISVGAHTSLWYRIGDDDIHRLSQVGEQMTARRGGRLYLRAALPGAFASSKGEANPENPEPPLSGVLKIRLIQWRQATESALNRAAQLAPEIFGPLREQRAQSRQPPKGWHYYWRMGKADIFHTCADDGALCCETHGDVGILQYPVELPLDNALRLSWSWCAETLPSQLAEHIQPTHDYLSIAVEFDNGLDLTYMWSAQLPEGTIFQCPLPWWDQRETHWVLRNSESGLNQWHDELRPIQADYRRAIGGPVPERVVAVWLIGNSVFQNGQGCCRYRAIKMTTATTAISMHE